MLKKIEQKSFSQGATFFHKQLIKLIKKNELCYSSLLEINHNCIGRGGGGGDLSHASCLNNTNIPFETALIMTKPKASIKKVGHGSISPQYN